MRDNGGERDTFSVPTSYFITTLPPPQNKNEANKLEIYESNNNCNIEVDESGGGSRLPDIIDFSRTVLRQLSTLHQAQTEGVESFLGNYES